MADAPIAHPCATGESAEGTVDESLGGNAFRFSGSATRFALEGLAPRPIPEPGEALVIYGAGNPPDRYGRIPVQAFTKSGDWLQGRHLRDGSALVLTFQIAELCHAAMMREERKAESEKAGQWARPDTLVPARDIARLLELTGRFVIVEGKVASIGNRKRRIYLNFGQNWSQDFTGSAAKQGDSKYSGDISALQRLEGATIRIRGMLENRGGPLIRIVDEAQIDIIGQ